MRGRRKDTQMCSNRTVSAIKSLVQHKLVVDETYKEDVASICENRRSECAIRVNTVECRVLKGNAENEKEEEEEEEHRIRRCHHVHERITNLVLNRLLCMHLFYLSKAALISSSIFYHLFKSELEMKWVRTCCG